jgi:quinol monooxygenase YgiN
VLAWGKRQGLPEPLEEDYKMPNSISWNLQMSVREGRLGDARELMTEMVTGTRQEPGTIGYEWFMSGDGKTCHINERHADSQAVMVHLGNFGSRYAERFLACFEPTSLSVYGEPSAEVRAGLDGFGAAYLGRLGGFTR